MEINDFAKYKQDLLNEIKALYEKQDLFAVIKKLENSELDFDLCNELVRAYINAANKTSDPYSLFEKANILLDKFSTQGKDNPKHLFYRGYILFKQCLIEDSKIRFERALRFASISDGILFNQITTMLSNANDLIAQAAFKGVDDKSKQELLDHIKKSFGTPEHLCSFNQVDLYRVAPNDKHGYNLLVSVGLSGKTQPSKNGGVESCEICLSLPKDYKFNPDSKSNFEIYLLIEVIRHLIAESNSIGFGYYLEKESGFSQRTAFNGAMLIGMGEYTKEEQSITLLNNVQVSFLELLPLRPMELNFRKSHSALELLDLFKEKLILITPFISTRDDVCMKVMEK